MQTVLELPAKEEGERAMRTRATVALLDDEALSALAQSHLRVLYRTISTGDWDRGSWITYHLDGPRQWERSLTYEWSWITGNLLRWSCTLQHLLPRDREDVPYSDLILTVHGAAAAEALRALRIASWWGWRTYASLHARRP